MKIKNILAGGCSFTQNGVGGIPPTVEALGGNSFREDIEFTAAEPMSWASFLAKKIDPDSFTNVAVSGHGNVATNKVVCDMLKKFAYRPDNTLIVFNVSSVDRLDVVCEYDKGEFSKPPWGNDIIDYSFLKPRGSEWKQQLLDTTIEVIEQQSVDSLYQLFDYLTKFEYPFVFTLMKDYTDLSVIQQYRDHLVPMPGNGMYEFCKGINGLSNDKFHPSTNGHQAVAELAYNFIHKKYNIGE